MDLRNKYLPFYIMIAIAISLIVAGATEFARNGDSAVVQADMLVHTGALANEAAALEAEAAEEVAEPVRSTTPLLSNPENVLTMVLSGEFSNGGYWTWQDINNLPAVYGVYDLPTVTVNGQTYHGVPLTYLLDYARINNEATRLVISTRSAEQYTYSVANVNQFKDYLVALDTDNTMTLIVPQADGFMTIDAIMRINAQAVDYSREESVPAPPNSSSIDLVGNFRHGGNWTWTDITNLLGVYSTQGQFRTVVVDGVEYSGVPIPYLMQYAEIMNNRANMLMFHSRMGERVGATVMTAQNCMDCIIAQAADGTLTAVLTGSMNEIVQQLSAIAVQ